MGGSRPLRFEEKSGNRASEGTGTSPRDIFLVRARVRPSQGGKVAFAAVAAGALPPPAAVMT